MHKSILESEEAAKLSPMAVPGIDKAINVKSIIKSVANVTGISIKRLGTHGREQEIVVPRQIAMYMLRKFIPEMSLAAVGKAVSNSELKPFDHATVLHSIRGIDLRREQSNVFDNRCITIEAVITGEYDFRAFTEAGANTAKLARLIQNVDKNKPFVDNLLSHEENFHLDQMESYRDVLRDYLTHISASIAAKRQKLWKNSSKKSRYRA